MASEEILQELVKTAVPLTKVINFSTAHMTVADSKLLAQLSLSNRERNHASIGTAEDWIVDREYGFLLQLTQREKRLETLLKAGVSAALYCLLESVTEDISIGFVCFDRDERIADNIPTFDW